MGVCLMMVSKWIHGAMYDLQHSGLGMVTNLKAGNLPKKATKTVKEMPSTRSATFLRVPMITVF